MTVAAYDLLAISELLHVARTKACARRLGEMGVPEIGSKHTYAELLRALRTGEVLVVLTHSHGQTTAHPIANQSNFSMLEKEPFGSARKLFVAIPGKELYPLWEAVRGKRIEEAFVQEEKLSLT